MGGGGGRNGKNEKRIAKMGVATKLYVCVCKSGCAYESIYVAEERGLPSFIPPHSD